MAKVRTGDEVEMRDGGKDSEDGAGGTGETEAELTKVQKRVMQPAGCRAYMRKKLAREFPGIVKGFVEVAKTGSVPHVKLATELLKPVRKGPKKVQRGAAVLLLEKLKKEEKDRERKMEQRRDS